MNNLLMSRFVKVVRLIYLEIKTPKFESKYVMNGKETPGDRAKKRWPDVVKENPNSIKI